MKQKDNVRTHSESVISFQQCYALPLCHKWSRLLSSRWSVRKTARLCSKHGSNLSAAPRYQVSRLSLTLQDLLSHRISRLAWLTTFRLRCSRSTSFQQPNWAMNGSSACRTVRLNSPYAILATSMSSLKCVHICFLRRPNNRPLHIYQY